MDAARYDVFSLACVAALTLALMPLTTRMAAMAWYIGKLATHAACAAVIASVVVLACRRSETFGDVRAVWDAVIGDAWVGHASRVAHAVIAYYRNMNITA